MGRFVGKFRRDGRRAQARRRHGAAHARGIVPRAEHLSPSARDRTCAFTCSTTSTGGQCRRTCSTIRRARSGIRSSADSIGGIGSIAELNAMNAKHYATPGGRRGDALEKNHGPRGADLSFAAAGDFFCTERTIDMFGDPISSTHRQGCEADAIPASLRLRLRGTSEEG